MTRTIRKIYRQTFNLKFRDDAAQYFGLVEYLRQNSVKFAVRDSEHLRIVECDEKFAPIVEEFMNNEEVVQFAREFAHSEARVRYAAF